MRQLATVLVLIVFSAMNSIRLYAQPPPFDGFASATTVFMGWTVFATTVALNKDNDSIPKLKRFVFYTDAGHYHSLPSSHGDIVMLDVGALYGVRKWVAVGGELNLYITNYQNHVSTGIGARPNIRFYLMNRPKGKLYMESNGGIIWMLPEFPEGGSHFNFTVVAGWGGEVRVSPNFLIHFGARFTHLSNGFLFGHDRNPAYNGLGGYVGFIYKLNQGVKKASKKGNKKGVE